MKVSIIVPVYNTKEYLRAAVESVLAQGEDLEVLLIDDGSTDGSGALCDELALHPLVRCIHQQNKYVGEARNVGIRAAKGEYLYFLDSDDRMESDVLSRLPATSADVICSAVRYERGKRLEWTEKKGSAEGLFLFSPYLGQSFYKREYVLQKGVFFSPERKTAEDCEWLFFVLQGATLEVADFPFYAYTEGRGGSLCTSYQKEAILPTLATWKRLFDSVKESDYPDQEAMRAYCADGLIQHCIRACMVKSERKRYLFEAKTCLPYLRQKGCKVAKFVFLADLIGVRAFFALCNKRMKCAPPKEILS